MKPEEALIEADRCVKCGFCLPHCPTYRETQNEGESPRGRIALIQGLLSGQLEDSKRLQGHLDRCLICRACEPACPSGVRYGRLIDAARQLHQQTQPLSKRLTRKMTLGLLTRRSPLILGTGLMRTFGRTALSRLARFSGIHSLERINQLTPGLPRPTRVRKHYPAPSTVQGRVGLFTGCISRITDQAALMAAIRVLNHLNQDVVVPPAQACCGAMHLHGGEPGRAHQLARTNHQAFDGSGLDAIVGIASGCMAHLREHNDALSTPVEDICAYLDTLTWPETLEPRPLPKRVAVHDPCSLRNVLKSAEAPHRLLRRIPQVELVALPENPYCCGAAGAYLLTQPEMSDALGARKIELLRQLQPDILVTSNTGCALQLAAGIRQAGLGIEVLHPVQLLERQLT